MEIALAAVFIPVLAAATAFILVGGGAAQSPNPERIPFQIATGSINGTYFPVGELLAGLLSHPPGIGRCETDGVCGPSGLIVSARASQGSIANVVAVNSGSVDSGLAQADVVAMAVAGRDAFAKAGPARHVRIIADLYPEEVHLVVSTKAHIASVAGLRGKRVSLSSEGSGTIATAREVLAAYGLSERSIRPNYDSIDRAAELLQAGKLDAFFFVGGAPVPLIEYLVAHRSAQLVPIAGEGRKRLLAGQNSLAATTIARYTYSGTSAIDTVSVDALWIARASEPDDLIYALVRALYNPANRAMLDAGGTNERFANPKLALQSRAAPLHPGAVRYYTETGLLKPAKPAPTRKP